MSRQRIIFRGVFRSTDQRNLHVKQEVEPRDKGCHHHNPGSIDRHVVALNTESREKHGEAREYTYKVSTHVGGIESRAVVFLLAPDRPYDRKVEKCGKVEISAGGDRHSHPRHGSNDDQLEEETGEGEGIPRAHSFLHAGVHARQQSGHAKEAAFVPKFVSVSLVLDQSHGGFSSFAQFVGQFDQGME